MIFQSIQFLLFFPAITAIYYLLPERAARYWLLAASIFFYACFDIRFLPSLFFCIMIAWLFGRIIDGTEGRSRKLFFLIGIILTIGQLAYRKYTSFAVSILNSIGFSIELENTPLLPVGISFFTFEAAGYLIDVYHKKYDAEKSLFSIALFLSFFPQLLSGPIARADQLLPQINQPKKFDYSRIRRGLLIMLWGFFLKMVIADRCGLYVDEVFDNYDHYSGIQILLAFVLYGIQIYTDFAGYSETARGAALALGYDIVINFKQPYFAQSVKDFWRRWHISLSTWLRDYIYIPLGGSRCSRIKKYRNIMITFLISGLWHGADWSFVLWGALHGLYQIIEDLIFSENKSKNDEGIATKASKALLTFILVDFAWIFFRAPTIQDAWYLIVSALHFGNLGQVFSGAIYEIGMGARNFVILSIGLVILLFVSVQKEKGIALLSAIDAHGFVYRHLCYWLIVILIVFSLSLSTSEFIYFQF